MKFCNTHLHCKEQKKKKVVNTHCKGQEQKQIRACVFDWKPPKHWFGFYIKINLRKRIWNNQIIHLKEKWQGKYKIQTKNEKIIKNLTKVERYTDTSRDCCVPMFSFYNKQRTRRKRTKRERDSFAGHKHGVYHVHYKSCGRDVAAWCVAVVVQNLIHLLKDWATMDSNHRVWWVNCCNHIGHPCKLTGWVLADVKG